VRDRDLPEDEQAIVAAVAHWVDREVRPHAGRLEREQQYPAALIDQLKCAAMALTEPSGGSDLQDIRTRAVRDGSGERTRPACSCSTPPGASTPAAAAASRHDRGRGTNEIQRHVIVRQLIARSRGD
jgi:hypothetical protein